MNTIPKVVASSTLENATWNATIINGDVGQKIRALKEQPAATSWPTHLKFSAAHRFDSGTMILEYTQGEDK